MKHFYYFNLYEHLNTVFDHYLIIMVSYVNIDFSRVYYVDRHNDFHYKSDYFFLIYNQDLDNLISFCENSLVFDIKPCPVTHTSFTV